MADLADYYREIYARGLAGETPSIPVAVTELEQRAAEAMDARAANYVFAGAGTEGTMRTNREAFERRRIVPRMLRDVAERDLSATLLGTPMPAPLTLAPIGVQKVVHSDGELATARAAATTGVPMIASTASHFTLEEIAAASGEGPRWFQLYWPNDRRLVESFARRAEAAGYGRDGQRELLPGPCLPRGSGPPPGGGPRRGDGALPRRLRKPVSHLGGPRMASGADLAADPRQGHPACR
jgi:L-lactate dehydrogenase (cytochrome)